MLLSLQRLGCGTPEAFERFVSVHPGNPYGVKPGDSRLLPLFQNGTSEPANLDQFPFSNKAKAQPLWQRAECQPGEAWFVEGITATTPGALTKSTSSLLCTDSSSRVIMAYPLCNQTTQQYLAFLELISRQSIGFTGNRVKVILTDQQSSLIDSKTVAPFRADTKIHMEAVPVDCHASRGTAEATQRSSMHGEVYDCVHLMHKGRYIEVASCELQSNSGIPH
mmetsp:Transcript_18069/g.55317  ORF Transcript_18069/g.55317 Transcript_18069/m.55317 type:complete len:222 (-) Transcript_18069:1458-2123(-)